MQDYFPLSLLHLYKGDKLSMKSPLILFFFYFKQTTRQIFQFIFYFLIKNFKFNSTSKRFRTQNLRLKRSECFRNFCETVFVSDTFLRLRQTMEQFGCFFCSFICPFSEGLVHSTVELNWLNLFKYIVYKFVKKPQLINLQ